MLRRMRWYLWVLAGIFLAYLVVSIYFMEHFFPGTTVKWGRRGSFDGPGSERPDSGPG